MSLRRPLMSLNRKPWNGSIRQLRYYYQRDRFLRKPRLTWENFIAHKPMQEAIEYRWVKKIVNRVSNG